MENEFNLSEKIHKVRPVPMPKIDLSDSMDYILLKDVKQALKLLKDRVIKRIKKEEHCDGCYSYKEEEECDTCKPHFDKIRAEFNKIFGDLANGT